MGRIDEQQYIEDYLAGLLSDNQKSDFESRMKKDETFRNSVATHRSLQKFLADHELMSFRKKVSTIHGKNTSPQSAPLSSPLRRILTLKRVASIAASFILLIYAIWWMNQAPKDATQFADLAITYLEPYPLPGTARGSLNSKTDLAYNYYIEQNYAEAAKVYTDLAASDTSNAFLQFAAGVSSILNDHPESAIQNLQRVVDSKALLFHQQARWYLALSYLHLESVKDAIHQLEQIDANHYKYDQAQKLLKELML